MAEVIFSQSGGELRIQDGRAHVSWPCWKTNHQPQRRTGIGLTDFYGDTNHARVFAKMSRNFKIHVTSKLIDLDCSLEKSIIQKNLKQTKDILSHR